MKYCGEKDDVVYLSYHDSATRKLKYTWELTKVDSGYIAINTQRSNLIAAEALEQKLIKPLRHYNSIKSEVVCEHRSRIDFLLLGSKSQCWLEVKSVTLFEPECEGGVLLFPDAVTTRGTKHIQALLKQVQKGHEAALLFLVNRPEGHVLKANHLVDPVYARELQKAHVLGLKVLAHRVHHTLGESYLGEEIPVDLTVT